MIGFEMSEDRITKKPLRNELVAQLWEGCRENGILFGRGGLWGQVNFCWIFWDSENTQNTWSFIFYLENDIILSFYGFEKTKK